MVTDLLAFGVRRSAFGDAADPEPVAVPKGQTPRAKRQTPNMERCPDCGQTAPLRHKGRRLVRCAACSLAALRRRKRAYQVAQRAARRERRRNGGVPCPPYVAWMCRLYGPGVWLLALASGEPIALAMPGFGTCSCGEAGCAHLVVACLAQQGGGRA